MDARFRSKPRIRPRADVRASFLEGLLLRAAGWLDGLQLFWAVQQGAVAVWLNETVGIPNDVELTVSTDLTNVHWLEGVLVAFVHLFLAAWGIEFEAVNGFANFVDVEGAGFFSGSGPNVNAIVSGFDWVSGYAIFTTRQVVLFAVSLEGFNEGFVFWGVDALEVVPSGQVTNQLAGVHGAQFVFRHGEGDDGAIIGGQALVGELGVEGNVGVTIDGGQDNGVARSGELFDFTNDGLVILVMERRVHFLDVGFGYAFLEEECLQHFVCGTWKHVVGAEEVELLGFEFVFGVSSSRNELLVRGGSGVEHVEGLFFAFVLHG